MLCVLFDYLFPAHAMHTAWQDMLPGFEWNSASGFIIGLVESYLYGWYIVLVWGISRSLIARTRSRPAISSNGYSVTVKYPFACRYAFTRATAVSMLACRFRLVYTLIRRSRSALPMTDTELKLIAAAASIGESRIPKKG